MTLFFSIAVGEIIFYRQLDYYKLPVEETVKLKKGPTSHSMPKIIAIYLCQQLGDHKLQANGKYFEFGHRGSVSYVTSTLRRKI